MNWYYSPDGTERHEVSEETLAALVREGRLTGEMLLWRDGLPDWRPAREVRPEWFTPSGASGPPPPPPDAGLSTRPVQESGSPGTGTGAPYYQPMPVKRPTDSSALISLISGIVGLLGASTGFCCCFGFLFSPVAGVVAVIFGHQVYNRTEGHAEASNDRTLALIGLILGYLTLALTVGAVIWNIVFGGLATMMSSSVDSIKSGSFPP